MVTPLPLVTPPVAGREAFMAMSSSDMGHKRSIKNKIDSGNATRTLPLTTSPISAVCLFDGSGILRSLSFGSDFLP